jgi:uncharacterized protein YjbI with pentapeptide repeats
MANPEHLAILKQGVEVWNRWKAEHRDVVPNLGGVFGDPTQLRDSYLREAEFFHVYLDWVDFARGNLDRAMFDSAWLRGSSFHSASLQQVSFIYANLLGVKFRDADLTGADLTRANCNGADFTGAVLTNAVLNETILTNATLAHCTGLETCQHAGPSRLDHQTLVKSGHLPLAFLRGCGLPDQFIDYVPSLLNQANQFYSCFMSYSTKDQEFADRLYADLQNHGVRSWLATEDLKIGDPFRQGIDEAIRHHQKLLVVLSSSSVASQWVEDEVESAFEKENREGRLVLLPIRIDNTVMESDKAWATKIRRRHIGDFSNLNLLSYEAALQRLLRDLNAEGAKDGR